MLSPSRRGGLSRPSMAFEALALLPGGGAQEPECTWGVHEGESSAAWLACEPRERTPAPLARAGSTAGAPDPILNQAERSSFPAGF